MMFRDTLKKLTPLVGTEKTTAWWQTYLAMPLVQRRDFENALETYAARLLDDVPSSEVAGLFPPPPPERCLGDVDLGHVLYGGKKQWPFGLRLEELNRHLGLYGSSGSGKSNGIALILDGLRSQGVPYLLCDFKRTFRSLLQEDPKLILFTAGDASTSPFRFNPLIPPPGTSPAVWSKKVIGALSHAYCQGAGSESLLVTALEKAYAEAASESRWPTFEDVSRILEEDKVRGRKAMWMDSARRAVTSVSTGNARYVFCPEQPMDLAKLLTRRVILELELLNPSEQTFLSEALLLWVIQYRMNEPGPRETLRHAILIEEAHHLLRSPPGIGDGSEPVIHVALREVRELGESVILATQNASVVPVAVFGNQATTLAFHTKHQRDVSSTAQAMLLRDEAKDELGRLPVGEAIVRAPRWRDPVHIRLMHRPIAKGSVTDAAIRERSSHWRDFLDTGTDARSLPDGTSIHPVPPADKKREETTESSTIYPWPENLAHGHASPAATPSQETPSGQQAGQTTGAERDLLQDILAHPFDGVVVRIKRLGLSRRKGTAALKALEARGLVSPETLYTGSSIIKLYDLTAQSRAWCQQEGMQPLPVPTEGGIEHRYWVHRIAASLESKGWRALKEHAASTDVKVDIHVERSGIVAAVLVETGRSNVAGNIQKTLDAGYPMLWVVSNNPGVKAAVERAAKEHVGAKIHFVDPRRLVRPSGAQH